MVTESRYAGRGAIVMGASPDEARVLVHEAVAAAGLGEVVQLARAHAGQRNDVWLVDTASGAAVVRLLHDDTRLAMEEAVVQRAATAGLPVAEILWSASGARPVMVQRRLRGRRLADVEPTVELCAAVARTLRAIHRIPIESGFGHLRPDLTGATPRLSQWFVDDVRNEARTAPHDGDDAHLPAVALDSLERARPLLDAQSPGLVHGDVQPFNLLVQADRVTGVLDWEAAKSGPPAFDLGWWDWFSVGWGTPWPADAMLPHYDPGGDVDREELNELRRLVVLRVWLRELVTALTNDEEDRAAAARRGLRTTVR